MASVPMSFAIAVRIAASSVRSSARRAASRAAARAGRRPRPWRRSPSRRCRAPAACRRRRTTARSRAGRGEQLVAALGERLRAQRADLVGLHQHRPPHVGDDRVEVGLLLGEERVEEARGAAVVHLARRAPLEQAAVLEEHVHVLPQEVVERLRQLLAHERVGARRLELPLGAARRSKAIVRQPRARASARPPRRAVAERDRDVVGLGSEVGLLVERPALAARPMRRQRALADDHRMHELDRHVARIRPRRRRGAERQQPPAAREALGHAVAQPRDALRLGCEEALARAAPRSAPSGVRRHDRGPGARRRAPGRASRGTRRRPRRCAR